MINATLIGLFMGLFTIVIFTLFKRVDKNIIYGLFLTGIGFYLLILKYQKNRNE